MLPLAAVVSVEPNAALVVAEPVAATQWQYRGDDGWVDFDSDSCATLSMVVGETQCRRIGLRCLRRRLRGYVASARASGAYVGTAFDGLRRRLRAYVASSGAYEPMTYAPTQVVGPVLLSLSLIHI